MLLTMNNNFSFSINFVVHESVPKFKPEIISDGNQIHAERDWHDKL